ncbi:hypothetical protein GCM10028808_04680 [Spirosoma migulaei]
MHMRATAGGQMVMICQDFDFANAPKLRITVSIPYTIVAQSHHIAQNTRVFSIKMGLMEYCVRQIKKGIQ